MTLLMHLSDVDEQAWANAFRTSMPNQTVVTRADQFDPAEIKYIFVWKPELNAFDGMTNLEVILSLGAGVDGILKHPKLPTHLPITRFVDQSLTHCMTDYVVANVGMHHRQATKYLREQKSKLWKQYYPREASTVNVGIMGMGELGIDAATALNRLGYNVAGWSRSKKDIEGVQAFAGPSEFKPFLNRTDILVNLLPLTPDTEDILCTQTFEQLSRKNLPGGPAIINAARGGHQHEPDIAAALQSGLLGAASLDVFKVEPLPQDSPLWDIDNCYITPHIAAISGMDAGVELVTKQIARYEETGDLLHVVDPQRGY